MTSHPLGNVFEAMMEKVQDQIPDEGFLMTKMPIYLADPNLNPNPNPNPNLNPYPNLNPKPNPFVVISAW